MNYNVVKTNSIGKNIMSIHLFMFNRPNCKTTTTKNEYCEKQAETKTTTKSSLIEVYLNKYRNNIFVDVQEVVHYVLF